MPTRQPHPPGDRHDPAPDHDDRLILAMEAERSEAERLRTPWKVLVVDDEAGVHSVTRLALDDFQFDGRSVQLLDAFSAAEAREILRDHPDIALILLDVVMESDDAGLSVVRYIRQELGNHFIRIVLRTGHPGTAPERVVLRDYDINDYRTKTEITQARMFSIVYTALASYHALVELARSRHQLRQMVVELERSNRELEQFAYIASHDLQAPLSSITSFTELLQRRCEGVLDSKSREFIGYIKGSTAQMRNLIEALLNLSRVGRGGIKQEEQDLGETAAAAIQQLKPLVDQRQVQIEVSDLPVVRGDSTLLTQLMLNLINNAIKFQEANPPRIRIFAQRGEAEWIIGVKDQGIGISPEHFQKIFQVFQRLNPAERFEGSGIGLAICEKIVHLHGGRIWVESEPGKGSTFCFSIPDEAQA